MELITTLRAVLMFIGIVCGIEFVLILGGMVLIIAGQLISQAISRFRWWQNRRRHNKF